MTEQIQPGDTVRDPRDPYNDEATVLFVDGNEAWVKYANGFRAERLIDRLTKVTPPAEPVEWVSQDGNEGVRKQAAPENPNPLYGDPSALPRPQHPEPLLNAAQLEQLADAISLPGDSSALYGGDTTLNIIGIRLRQAAADLRAKGGVR